MTVQLMVGDRVEGVGCFEWKQTREEAVLASEQRGSPENFPAPEGKRRKGKTLAFLLQKTHFFSQLVG